MSGSYGYIVGAGHLTFCLLKILTVIFGHVIKPPLIKIKCKLVFYNNPIVFSVFISVNFLEIALEIQWNCLTSFFLLSQYDLI